VRKGKLARKKNVNLPRRKEQASPLSCYEGERNSLKPDLPGKGEGEKEFPSPIRNASREPKDFYFEKKGTGLGNWKKRRHLVSRGHVQSFSEDKLKDVLGKEERGRKKKKKEGFPSR